jgi:hypothetical protein
VELGFAPPVPFSPLTLLSCFKACNVCKVLLDVPLSSLSALKKPTAPN